MLTEVNQILVGIRKSPIPDSRQLPVDHLDSSEKRLNLCRQKSGKSQACHSAVSEITDLEGDHPPR